MSEQEKRNAHEKQEAEHLASLVEKYVSGERIAQRLQAAFARLRREQARHDAESMQALEADLEALTDQELDLEEQLYDFDNRAAARVGDLTIALQTSRQPNVRRSSPGSARPWKTRKRLCVSNSKRCEPWCRSK